MNPFRLLLSPRSWGICGFLLLCAAALAQDVNPVSSVYIGGHIRRERPNTITKLRNSGFTTAILFNVHVDTDGTLMTDGETICKNGEYVFQNTQPYYVKDIQDLKTAPTSISRIEICIGGWGNDSYDHIRDIINAAGSNLEETMLYKNFKALKETLPEIDAVNNDDEHCYDYQTAAKFHRMMADLGYTSTLAPYTNKSFWQNLANNLNRYGCLDRILIQCYDGGAGNNPSDWHLVSNIPLHAGLLHYGNDWNMDTNRQQFTRWRDNCAVAGGFVWVYNDETWNLNDWATSINRIYGAMTCPESDVAVRLFSDANFGGYSIALPAGSYQLADLALWGMKDNDIESAEITEGYEVTFFTATAAKGSKHAYTESQPTFGRYDNKFRSLVVTPVESGIASVETDAREEYFAPDGQRLARPQRGVTIVRKADGTARTVVRK